MDTGTPIYDTPTTWLLIFSGGGDHWISRLVPGRHKHVCCIGWCPTARTWVFYNVGAYATSVFVIEDGKAAKDMIAKWCAGATVVQMPASRRGRPLWAVFGFWCTTAVAHIVGIRSGAVLPDLLLRHCVRNGGEVVQG
jgi:hypothetical protein